MTFALCFVCAGTGFVIGRDDSTTCRTCVAGAQAAQEHPLSGTGGSVDGPDTTAGLPGLAAR